MLSTFNSTFFLARRTKKTKIFKSDNKRSPNTIVRAAGEILEGFLRLHRIRREFLSVCYSHSRNCGKTGTSEGLWDRLGRRVEIALMNNCFSWQSVV